MKETDEITAKRIEAARHRSRLMDTAQDLQSKLNPKRLTRNAWEGAKEKGQDLADDAVDAARAKPKVAAGVGAAVGLFLLRKPLAHLACKAVRGVRHKDTDQDMEMKHDPNQPEPWSEFSDDWPEQHAG